MSEDNQVEKTIREPRETDITLSIRRAYNVGPFETLEIKVETTDKIKWSSMEERFKKTEGLTQLLVKKFENSHKVIFQGLDVVEKNATYRNASKD